MGDRVERVVVVIPARDEQELIGRALVAVRAAAERVQVPVDVVVVSNGSTDATATVARDHRAVVVELPEPQVGAARAAGVAAMLDRSDGASTWIACTDADSAVPPEWLAHHLDLAAAGADAVVGTITLAPVDLVTNETWWTAYRSRVDEAGHGHVHGANLGVRAQAYLAVGGFAAVPAHEDVDLVGRLRVAHRVVHTVSAPVVTSARSLGRLVGGVADDLARAGRPAGRPAAS